MSERPFAYFFQKRKVHSYKTENTSLPDPFFKREVYLKTIFRAVKETGQENITISFDNPDDGIYIVKQILNKSISLHLADSYASDIIAEYFLEQYGVPIPLAGRVKSGLYVYCGGEKIPTLEKVYTLDLVSGGSEFFIKDFKSPLKTDSLYLLNRILMLTDKNLSDIIVKPCIICQK